MEKKGKYLKKFITLGNLRKFHDFGLDYILPTSDNYMGLYLHKLWGVT
jgi:hypothetical protein